MTIPVPLRGANPLRVLVCLLVVLSFLYNPYITAQVLAGALNLRHPFSHRATVGSSELERYSTADSQAPINTLDCPIAEDAIHLTDFAVSFSSLYHRELHHVTFRLQGSLWFRPPPAL